MLVCTDFVMRVLKAINARDLAFIANYMVQ